MQRSVTAILIAAATTLSAAMMMTVALSTEVERQRQRLSAKRSHRESDDAAGGGCEDCKNIGVVCGDCDLEGWAIVAWGIKLTGSGFLELICICALVCCRIRLPRYPPPLVTNGSCYYLILFVLGTKGRMQLVVMAPKNLSTKH